MDYQSQDFKGCVNSSVFSQIMSDPNNSDCTWIIAVDDTGKSGNITGNKMCSSNNSGNDGPSSGNGSSSAGVVIKASFGGGSVLADFSAVGGASRLAGYWNRASSSIEWGDGSTWKVLQASGIRAGMRASVALACLAVFLLLM